MRVLSFIVTLLITLPLTLFALGFALSNPWPVGVSLWPFEFAAQPAPQLGVLGAALLGIGFFAGALFVGVLSQGWRYRAWREKRRADRLETALQVAEEKLLAAAQPAPDETPVLPARRTG